MALGVLGLLTITAIPTTIGVSQAVSAQKKQNAAEKERAKFKLAAVLPDGREAFCVLTDGKVYIDHPEKPVKAHQFNGYYFTYPSEERHRGLVSTISDDPPMLNWIFVDGSTGVLRHGKRSDTLSEGVVVGPWGWSEDERDLALKGRSDLFVAVQELEEDGGRWYVYFDATGTGVFPDDAGLLPRVRRKMRVVLRRKMALGMESRYIKNDGS